MREHEYARSAVKRSGKRRFDDDDPNFLKRFRPDGERAPEESEVDDPDRPPTGDRWSTWDQSSPTQRGPLPLPDWVVTELGAVDTELGMLKTGKEADVYLVQRGVPETDRSTLLAAKRYRAPEHRLFHRDSGYLEGRRVRESRTTRAMQNRTGFGREAIAGQWAAAEFSALCRLYTLGREHGAVSVPYPVQIVGTELLLEFIGDQDGTAAPRLAQARPDPDELADLWRQLVDALTVLARAGLAHGDLSAYNLLVHEGRLVLIDLPQVVDVVANPQGREFLVRDVKNVATWFSGRGLAVEVEPLTEMLLTDAGM